MAILTFTERQQKTITAAVTLLCGAFILGVILWLTCLLGAFAGHFSNVLMPLAVAGILAMVFQPYYDLLLKFARGKSVIAVLILYATVIVPLTALIWFFGAVLADQLSQLIQQLPQVVDNVWAAVKERLPFVMELWEKHGIEEKMKTLLG